MISYLYLYIEAYLGALKAFCDNNQRLKAIKYPIHCFTQKKFSVKDFSVNVTKSAISSGFSHVYWGNIERKTLFFVLTTL